MTDDSVINVAAAPKARPTVVKEATVLDRLRGELRRKVERPEILIEVPSRPGVFVRCSPNITQEQMKAWRKNSGEDSKAGFNSLKFACYVVGGTCTGIKMGDEIVMNDEGVELTFASPEILDATETHRPIPDCVQAFFGVDPHVEGAALAIMDAAGWGDTVEAVDPTKMP